MCAPYNRTALDEWLLGQFPEVERIGLHNPSLALPRCAPPAVNPETFWPPVRVEALFTHSVACDEEAHEVEKNRALFQAIAQQEMPTDVPRLTVPTTLTQSVLPLVHRLGLEAGQYVVGCPTGGCNVPLKAWPAEHYVAVLEHLYHQHHLPALLTGVASDAAQVQAMAEAAQSQGVGVAVWIGSDAELGLFLGLLRHSRLYVGADTGPMHFAGALGVPVVAHLGGGTWPRFLPLASRCFVATQQLPCFGCGWQCWFDEAMCMRLTSPDMFQAGLDWILSQAEDERRIETGHRLDPMTVDLLQKGYAAHQASEADRGARLAILHQLQAQCENNQIQAAELAAKEAVIQTLGQDLEAKEEGIQAQHRELAAKGAVIQQLETLRRAALRHHWGVQRLRAGVRRLEQWAQGQLSPRLGVLQQYPPIPLRIPPHYTASTSLVFPPRISLVTPTFNHAHFLAHTLHSVLHQQYPALEYLVQDGGSTDETLTILERYGSRLAHLESVSDHGQAHALNRGFGRATGEIMAYLNSDDVLLPGALHYVAAFFATHPAIDVVYGHRVLIDAQNGEIGRWVLPPHDDPMLRWADYVPQETLFWRRRVWEKAGGYVDESYQFALDWELILRFQQAGATFKRLPRFLGAFRVHATQKTSNQLDTLGQQEMARLRERCHGRPVSHVEIAQGIRPYMAWSVVYHTLYRLGVLPC